MCGRYANHVKSMQQWTPLLQDWPENVALGYNVAPTAIVPAFRGNKGVGMRWGLIPHWSKDDKSKYATFNARLESVESKPTYRTAWRHSNKCLIPALGYYEWRVEGGRKQPYFVTSSETEPLVFAGIWDEWNGDGKSILSCSIITKSSIGELVPLHDRMPVMLTVGAAEHWLDADVNDAREMLEHAPLPELLVYKVGLAVNNVKNQGQALIEPLNQELK